MILDAYVIYQSYKAAEDMFEVMRTLPGRVSLQDIHYIDDETAAANLDIALMTVALEDGPWQ